MCASRQPGMQALHWHLTATYACRACHACSNLLTGSIPASWGGIGNSSTALVHGRLYLWGNRLSGQVPAGFLRPVGDVAWPGTGCALALGLASMGVALNARPDCAAQLCCQCRVFLLAGIRQHHFTAWKRGAVCTSTPPSFSEPWQPDMEARHGSQTWQQPL